MGRKKESIKDLIDRSSLGTPEVKALAGTVSDEEVDRALKRADQIHAEKNPITHVAIKFKGKTYSLPRPNRHHHVIREIIRLNPEETHVYNDVQGFLDASGQFLNRKDALVRAILHNQLKDPSKTSGGLFSEDVW